MRKNKVDRGISIQFDENTTLRKQRTSPFLRKSSSQTSAQPVNTWRYARQFRISLSQQNSSEKNKSEESLSLQLPYSEIPKEYAFSNSTDVEEYIDTVELVYESPVQAFVEYVDKGEYPPSYITIAIAQGFKSYLEARGGTELEEIFFGKPTRGRGCFAQRLDADMNYKDFLDEVIGYTYTVDDELLSSNKKTLVETAENFLSRNSIEIDVDTFLRGYRRWLTRELERMNHKTKQSLSQVNLNNVRFLQYKDGSPLTNTDMRRIEAILVHRELR